MLIVIASYRVAREFARTVLEVGPDGYTWISPTDRFAIAKLRGHTQDRITVYRPLGEAATGDVEAMLQHLGATEIAI